MRASELDDLLPQLCHPDPSQRSAAAGALGALGPDGIPAVTPLYEACRDERMYVRGEAVHSLWEIASAFWGDRASAAWPLLETGVPTLITLPDDPWLDVRCSAMSVLKEIGPAAGPALPRLRAALTEDRPSLTVHPEGWDTETEVRLLRKGAVEAIKAIAKPSEAEPVATPAPAPDRGVVELGAVMPPEIGPETRRVSEGARYTNGPRRPITTRPAEPAAAPAPAAGRGSEGS